MWTSLVENYRGGERKVGLCEYYVSEFREEK